MPHSIGLSQPTINDPVIEFKAVMATTIQRWIEDDESRTKKALAMDLGATQADLSHWLSPRTRFTMPGHLIGLFCSITGDNSLSWTVLSQTKAPGVTQEP